MYSVTFLQSYFNDQFLDLFCLAEHFFRYANPMWEKRKIRRFSGTLLDWYRRSGRKLPWRDNPTPYRVWISEIMLQQTQISTVLPYYDRFLKRFPDLESLARAKEHDLLESWAGLGYYRRARNLHRAARSIIEKHQTFPEEFSAVLALPGIGRYTAGAICSIAFNQPYPAVDGNVRRVVTRLTGLKQRVSDVYFWNLASAWIPQIEPSSFNQAMMDLGAMICVPGQPRCTDCPVSRFCEAKKLGIQTSIPAARRKLAVKQLRIVVLKLQCDGKLLLREMETPGLIPGTWGLPWRAIPEGVPALDAAAKLCRAALGRRVRLQACGRVRHTITGNQISATAFCGKVESAVCETGANSRWVRRSSAWKLLTSSIFHKVLRQTGP